MTSNSAYEEMLSSVQKDLFLIIEQWKRHFGPGFERTCQGTGLAASGTEFVFASESLKELVQAAQRRLNEAGRVGEASLFIRDPREDRLVLVYSTSRNLLEGTASTKQVHDFGTYFDQERRLYVYPLHDRLAEVKERESDRAREARGLTGWVAVAGHHLLVNGEYGRHGLLSLTHDRPETLGACQTYGFPMWGHHISEAPIDPAHPKRYLAVPVKSSTDGNRTIGVLRYACPSSGKELTIADLIFFQEIAGLVSSVIGLDDGMTRVARGTHVAYEKDHLRRTYDFDAFLTFVARSLRSSISSVYLDLRGITGSESRLRLLEAHGIRDSVAHLRSQLADYASRDGGFTRWLFDRGSTDATVVPSVHTHGSWQGKNTSAFYGLVLKQLVAGDGATRGQPTEVARHYTIKIIGLPLVYGGERVGVLKVELPNSFDDARHYDRADQTFLLDCATQLAETVGEFQAFLKGDWFRQPRDSVRAVVNVSRMLAQLLRTQVLLPSEAPQFWKGLAEFINERRDEFEDEMQETIDRLSPDTREAVQASHSWLQGTAGEAGSFAHSVVIEVLAKAFVHAAIG